MFWPSQSASGSRNLWCTVLHVVPVAPPSRDFVSSASGAAICHSASIASAMDIPARVITLATRCTRSVLTYVFCLKKNSEQDYNMMIFFQDIATNPFSSFLSKLCKMLSCSQNSQTRDHQPSTYDNMEAKLIDTNAVELQEVDVPPVASSTLSRSLNSTSCASLRKASNKNVSIFSNIDCQLFTSSSQSQALGEKLISTLEVLEEDGEKYRVKLANLKASGGIDTAQLNYFDEHGKLIADQLKVLKEVGTKLGRGFPQSSSTPYRSASVKGAKLSLSAVESRLEKSSKFPHMGLFQFLFLMFISLPFQLTARNLINRT